MRIFALIVALCGFLGGLSSAVAAPRRGATCLIVESPAALSDALSSTRMNHKATLIYARADWAVAGLFANDQYVPSIAFLELIGDTTCVIADVTRVGSNALIEQFDAGGIPFFALVDAEGKVLALLRAARSFSEFQEWLQLNLPSSPETRSGGQGPTQHSSGPPFAAAEVNR